MMLEGVMRAPGGPLRTWGARNILAGEGTRPSQPACPSLMPLRAAGGALGVRRAGAGTLLVPWSCPSALGCHLALETGLCPSVGWHSRGRIRSPPSLRPLCCQAPCPIPRLVRARSHLLTAVGTARGGRGVPVCAGTPGTTAAPALGPSPAQLLGCVRSRSRPGARDAQELGARGRPCWANVATALLGTGMALVPPPPGARLPTGILPGSIPSSSTSLPAPGAWGGWGYPRCCAGGWWQGCGDTGVPSPI